MSSRDLVLLGGGHAHVLAIRALAMRPAPDTRITLISEHSLTPYSGMLPGYVAGHYRFDEAHIDLNRLCQRCAVRWVRARAVGLDLDARRVELSDGAAVEFDWLSVDTGSRPDTSTPGAAEHAVGVKPVSGFAARWQRLLREVSDQAGRALHIGVVGAGAGGTELALAIAHRLRDAPGVTVHLVYPDEAPLAGYPRAVTERVEGALAERKVHCHPQFRVAKVTAEGVESERGARLALGHTLWCTAASAPAWPAKAGLATDTKGFITVDEHLRSVSHPFVFAAGDIAHMPFDPRPKAGVYAVRQAPTLTENLRNTAAGTALKSIRLQKHFLSLLSLGDKAAVGTRNGFSVNGGWVWRWKDHIDRAFMTRVATAGGAMQSSEPATAEDMHCAGCASKLGPDVISGTVAALPVHENARVVPALAGAEDAARWQPTPGHDTVQSLDGFRAFTEDGYALGRIATNHALSDIYAMGGTPVSALIWVNLAFNHIRLQARDHRRIMRGVADALLEQHCVLAGGHSSEGAETHLGVAVTGELPSGDAVANHTVKAGDALILTKPLGTGVILAANQTGEAPPESVDAAFASMLESNRTAAMALHGAHAMTDVTGFGLFGHLLEMLAQSELVAVLWRDAIPAIQGATDLLDSGVRSTLYPALEPMSQQSNLDTQDPLTALCLDPQTSGGLLAAVPSESVQALLEQHTGWRCIGAIRPSASSDLGKKIVVVDAGAL
ncbi:MAG: selenide, water dikinase SelD [Pseudomonadota bacterium]